MAVRVFETETVSGVVLNAVAVSFTQLPVLLVLKI
jgi:hypothetical protein